jgi:hypothetical protein
MGTVGCQTATVFDVSYATIKKRLGNGDAQDCSYRARVPLTTLSDSGCDRAHGAPIGMFAVGRPSFRRTGVHRPDVFCSAPPVF